LRGKIKQLKKIKVGIVNYLNTRPLLYGINNSPVHEAIELVEDYPSNIASYLLESKIDIGLVPVAVLPEMKEYHIYTDYCIGSNGPVASVCLFSDVPIDEVNTVLLDYQSRTSVALLKVLLRDYWKITPRLMNTKSDYRSSIKGTTAGLVIGDRALEQRKYSRYIYDLGEAWTQHTGLPFVFAAWISRSVLEKDFVRAFNEANKFGVEHINTIIRNDTDDLFDLQKYYTNYISYSLDANKRKGLAHFLTLLPSIKPLRIVDD
jgi:chorismate dehydratase